MCKHTKKKKKIMHRNCIIFFLENSVNSKHSLKFYVKNRIFNLKKRKRERDFFKSKNSLSSKQNISLKN